MIYFSCFSNKLLDNIEYNKKYSISLGGNWERYMKISYLAPTSNILNWWKSLNHHTQDDINKYTELYYKEVLNKLDVHSVAKELDGKVLLCFEKPNEFCHRHLVRQWLTDNGYIAIELNYKRR